MSLAEPTLSRRPPRRAAVHTSPFTALYQLVHHRAALSLPSLPPLGGSTRSLPSLGSSRLSLDDDGGDAPLPPPSRRRVLELPRLEERPVAFSWWAFTNPSPPARAEAPAVHR